MACGPEGLSAALIQSPLAVGTRTGLSVERCLKRDLVGPGKALLPCVDTDALTEVALSGDVDRVAVTDGGLGGGEHWFELEAQVAGPVRLKVTAHDELGQVFTADVAFDVFTPRTLRFIPFLPAGGDPRLSYLLGARVPLPECEITDQRDLPYFTLDFATRTSGSLAPSDRALGAVSTGPGVYEPVSDVLRAAGPGFEVTVVDPGDVRGLVLARDLVDDAGVVSLPPRAVTALSTDGGSSPHAIQVMPLYALVDGGWAHPLSQDFEAATIELADGGVTSWPCFESSCLVGVEPGTVTYRLGGQGASVTVTVTP